ncbi:MAG: hypothetical protein WBB31_11785 [Saprospiraceae bacterium]
MKKHIHLLGCIAIVFGVKSSNTQVPINELQASNAITFADPYNGEFNDWLELYNSGTNPTDLTGWHRYLFSCHSGFVDPRCK